MYPFLVLSVFVMYVNLEINIIIILFYVTSLNVAYSSLIQCYSLAYKLFHLLYPISYTLSAVMAPSVQI